MLRYAEQAATTETTGQRADAEGNEQGYGRAMCRPLHRTHLQCSSSPPGLNTYPSPPPSPSPRLPTSACLAPTRHFLN